jgi:acetyl-CoA carboxylase biotin carboxyl carrier protein
MGDNTYTLTSPVMGTFYRASAPGEKALVEEGQAITPADIICVIESMKIFTELRSEHPGVVKKILVENEDSVMKNQALIEIELN